MTQPRRSAVMLTIAPVCASTTRIGPSAAMNTGFIASVSQKPLTATFDTFIAGTGSFGTRTPESTSWGTRASGTMAVAWSRVVADDEIRSPVAVPANAPITSSDHCSNRLPGIFSAGAAIYKHANDGKLQRSEGSRYKDVHQGGLARAIGANDAYELGRADAQIALLRMRFSEPRTRLSGHGSL
jgi:hypothetical protein